MRKEGKQSGVLYVTRKRIERVARARLSISYGHALMATDKKAAYRRAMRDAYRASTIIGALQMRGKPATRDIVWLFGKGARMENGDEK
jgi:hypothetical protein